MRTSADVGGGCDMNMMFNLFAMKLKFLLTSSIRLILPILLLLRLLGLFVQFVWKGNCDFVTAVHVVVVFLLFC